MIIVSGLSGAGKTVALHALEDLGYYCIDNLPISMLPALSQEQKSIAQPVAVGIDIRSNHSGTNLTDMMHQLKAQEQDIQILYLTANNSVLIKRFSESRRKHPLSEEMGLADAIVKEQKLLSPLALDASFQIDTSTINVYELKDRIREWLDLKSAETFLTIESFGFKHGVPVDADLMFDVRFLPNPYWVPELRAFTGRDPQIQEYLGKLDECERFIADTLVYLSRWLPTYFKSSRSYLTVAIGCTGGKHRSVYTTEQLADRLSQQFGLVNIRHRDLPH